VGHWQSEEGDGGPRRKPVLLYPEFQQTLEKGLIMLMDLGVATPGQCVEIFKLILISKLEIPSWQKRKVWVRDSELGLGLEGQTQRPSSPKS
jgi:hypothetical protein